jgi:ATP-dependent 26S proteasome regulatory subunit
MSQIRSCITEYCILPLGSQYVKDTTPLINAVLLYGAKGTGKTMLARAVAKATGAVWFDLSPANVRARLTGHPK